MQPALFVSHGAPSLVMEPGPSRNFLCELGPKIEQQFGRPRAILCISAHWNSATPLVAATAKPDTIHDFYGFPEALYRLRYEAPGAPELAARSVALLEAAGIKAATDPDRGLDHGAWAPLLLMWPDADIPVAQLSVQPGLDAAHHWAIGRALAPLRREGILVLASGGVVHNLRSLSRGGQGGGTPEWASGFTAWLAEKLAAEDLPALLDWRRAAPHADLAQPTDEHFLPFFVALGAGGDKPKAKRLYAGFDHGSLGMDAYVFPGGA